MNSQHLNRQVKDNVFKVLFSKEKNLFSLLKSEGFNIEELKKQPISSESIKGIFLTSGKNDIGFLFGNLLIVLLEAQSTFKIQDIIRFFKYGLKDYLNYLNFHNKDLGDQNFRLPQLTIFCIYTGNKKLKREYRLTKDFYSKEYPYNSLDLCVYIIDKENVKDPIVSQYITFSQRVTELWYAGKTSPADVAAFLKEMLKEGILTELIEENKAEVPGMIENEVKNYGERLIEEAVEKSKEKTLKNAIENLAKRLRLQSNDQLSMEEALEQAKEWLTEPV